MENFIYKNYQKLGDYFTGSHRRQPVYLAVACVFIITTCLTYCYKITVSEGILNSVFSSITQALLSLVAFLGVAALFKLEGLRNEENQIMQTSLHSEQYSWLTNRLQGKVIITGEDLMNEFNTIFKEGNPNEEKVRILKSKLEFLFISRKLTQERIVTFTIYTFFVVFVSLGLLIFAPFLSHYYLGVSSLFLILLLTAYCAFLVIKGVSDAVYH